MATINGPDAALQRFLEIYQLRSNQKLKTTLELDYPNPRLGEAMRYACLSGGKRLRPVLVYAAAEAVGAKPEIADDPAVSVELVHCYSLAHDDLPAMDNDDLRRGLPTVHKAFDEATAILVGDALQTLAFEVLSASNPDLGPAITLTMVRSLGKAAGALGMVGGQATDFAASGQALGIEQLKSMHSMKTGALISCSVTLGALCNPKVSQKQLQGLESYAANIGLAFQVQDDILDVTADTQTLGKPQGSDKALDKPTFVSLLGLEAAARHAAELSDAAICALVDFDESANPLRALARYIVNRTF
jgi:geranylgeranyl diphosphate synthase, type II